MDYFLLAVFLGVAGYVWWRLEAARRTEAWEEKQRDDHRLRIAKDPKNVGAYEALGDSLRRAGRLDEAHEAYLGALDAGSDESVLDRTRYKIAQLDRDLRAQAQLRGGSRAAKLEPEIVFCRQCGEGNLPLRPRCANCHAALPFHTLREALMNRDVQIASLESACILVVLLIVLRVFYFFPLEIKSVVTMSAIIVSGWRFLRAIEGK
ncbi:MAG: hypothetical protein M3Y28_01515 [Armatimonadota bacterium]|nr:hypothetical protein [Armatimonadota bacterium]